MYILQYLNVIKQGLWIYSIENIVFPQFHTAPHPLPLHLRPNLFQHAPSESSLLDSEMMAFFLESIYNINENTIATMTNTTTMKPFDIWSIALSIEWIEHEIMYMYKLYTCTIFVHVYINHLPLVSY